MEEYVCINPDEFQDFATTSTEGTVFMLNFLRYKAVVPETGQTGKEAYKDYMREANTFIKSTKAEVLFYGKPEHMLIGPMTEKVWDAVLLVKYPTIEAFLKMVKSKGYPSHLRERALADSRLIHCKSYT